MMNFRNWKLIVAGVVLAGCSSGELQDEQHIGQTVQSLNGDVGHIPIPCKYDSTTSKFREVWDGNTVQLVIADTLDMCQSLAINIPYSTRSPYLVAIQNLMNSSMAAVGSETDWAKFRGWNSCDLENNLRRPYPLPRLTSHASLASYNSIKNQPISTVYVGQAAFEACMAQGIEQVLSSGAGLLLPQEEQLELANVGRLSAQKAVQIYSVMLALAGNNHTGSTSVPTDEVGSRLRALQAFLTIDEPTTQVNNLRAWQQDITNRLGEDFVGSTQILIESTKNLTSLMARSRSARDAVPGGKNAATYGWKTAADESWGRGSWTQRLVALNLGGDPLGITPGAAPISWYGTWRTGYFLPYVRVDASAPEVATLLRLLRQFYATRLHTSVAYGTCRSVDVAATAAAWKADLNAKLNYAACPSELQACAGYVARDLLFENYRITDAHIQTGAQLFAEVLPQVNVPSGTAAGSRLAGCDGSVMPALRLSGALSINSSNVVTLTEWDFQARNVEDVAAPAARDGVAAQTYLRLPLPDEVRFAKPNDVSLGFNNVEVEARTNGMDATIVANWNNTWDPRLYREYLAVIPTLTAARHILAEVIAKKTAAADRLLPGGAAGGRKLVSAIDAAIGSSLYMVPNDVKSTVSGRVTFTSTAEVTRIAGDPADPFWSDPSTTKPMYLLRIPNSQWLADIVRSPESWIHSVNLAKLLSENASGAGVLSPQLTHDAALSELGRPVWKVNFPPGSVWNYGLVAIRFDDGNISAASLAARSPETLRKSVRLISAGLPERASDDYHGTYLAFGGALGNDVSRQITPKASNPSEFAYDGFGIPTDWVPPFSGEDLGGGALTSSADYYMTSARSAGQDASFAVQRAVDGLLLEEERQRDEDAAAHEKSEASRKAKLKAQEGLREEKASLCGNGKPECKVSLSTSALSSSWYTALPSGVWPVECPTYNDPYDPIASPRNAVVMDNGNVVNALWGGLSPDASAQVAAAKADAEFATKTAKCFVRRVVDNFLSTQFQLADTVQGVIGQSSQPAFLDFSGGALQGALIEQWLAIKSPNDQLASIIAGLDSAQATIEASNAVLARASQEVRVQCSAYAMFKAFTAGWSVGFLSATWSSGPLVAQTDRCDTATANLGPEIKRAAATNKDVVTSIADRVQGMTDAAGRITKSGAELARIQNQSGLATARVALEEQLDQINPLGPMSNGLFRRYRAYDIWRARALIENARRYAVAARRAIEARYAVNLSTLSQDEAFVKSPSTWADEIYRYDLNLPSSLGLTTGGQANGGIYSNVVEDYIRNLQAFVDGYAVSRPTATAKGDVEVLLLPGLSDGGTDPVTFGTGSSAVTYHSPRTRGAWMVHCPTGAPKNAGAWVYLSGQDAARTVCDTAGVQVPDAARLNFSLDPWARVNGNLAKEPFENRYNARWERLALNLVGTGIRDCSGSPDPQSCFNEGFIRYNLRHQGIAWITDFVGQWRALNLPPGVVESGKALSIEAWLDPLKNGWETPYVSAVSRSELALRPFGGDYMIELTGGRDVHLERVERIQLMAGMSYWVAQR